MDYTWTFLNMLLLLLIVCIGAIFLLRYFLPRLMGGQKYNKGNYFEVLIRYGLDVRRSLYVVRAGERFFILGGAENGITCLTELKSEDLGELLKKNEK